MKKIVLFITIFFLSFSGFCQTDKLTPFKSNDTIWWKLDYKSDSVPGTSWNKAIKFLKKIRRTPQKKVSIGILDSDFDLNHIALKGIIWKNKKEIPENELDDDKNGFVDDTNGWNFMGLKNQDSSLAYIATEESRILGNLYGQKLGNHSIKKKVFFDLEEVKFSYDKTINQIKEELNPNLDIEPSFTFVIDTLRKLIKNPISLETLSSYETENDTIRGYIDFAKYYYQNDFPYDDFISYLNHNNKILELSLNQERDDRMSLGDNIDCLKDLDYGNNAFGKNLNILEHGTLVAGVVASSVLDINNLENKQLVNSAIDILPVSITAVGNYLDKDFYSGIKYAVDNGAQIINFSQGKSFSLSPKILKKALDYANKKGVLVIISAGNESENLDIDKEFPQSIPKFYNKEFKNLIVVGASTDNLNEDFVEEDSNYGINSVTIFAPGTDIRTTLPFDKITEESGTSFAAPIVVNIAALIWSYYPQLKAKDIKDIILKSGQMFDIQVKIPTDEDDSSSEKKVPFWKLSKSGKLVNAYNAIVLAEKITSE